MIDPALRGKLKCLQCGGSDLHEHEDRLVIACGGCRHEIPVRDGIPDVLAGKPSCPLVWPDTEDPHRYEAYIAGLEPSMLKWVDEPLLQDVQGDVLEIGCGTCRLEPLVEQRGGRYFGLDPDMAYLRYAQRQRRVQRLVRGQGERLPFRDGSFDYLFSGWFAYRNVRPEEGLPEARRVLKRGGMLAFTLFNVWRARLMAVKRSMKQGRWLSLFTEPLYPPPSSFDFVRRSHLQRAAESAGFLMAGLMSTPASPMFSRAKGSLGCSYYRGRWDVYRGYDVIVLLRADAAAAASGPADFDREYKLNVHKST